MDDVEDVADFPRDGVVLGECNGADVEEGDLECLVVAGGKEDLVVCLFMLKVVADCAFI
jgi:hypothetical protein